MLLLLSIHTIDTLKSITSLHKDRDALKMTKEIFYLKELKIVVETVFKDKNIHCGGGETKPNQESSLMPSFLFIFLTLSKNKYCFPIILARVIKYTSKNSGISFALFSVTLTTAAM